MILSVRSYMCSSNGIKVYKHTSHDLVVLLSFFSDFIEVPSPPVVVVPLDGVHNTYEYRCSHSETDRIFWIINGTRLVDIVPHPPSISTLTILLPSGELVYTLTIGGLPQHNGTTIQCLAESQDQLSTAVTPNAMFLIQGERTYGYYLILLQSLHFYLDLYIREWTCWCTIHTHP